VRNISNLINSTVHSLSAAKDSVSAATKFNGLNATVGVTFPFYTQTVRISYYSSLQPIKHVILVKHIKMPIKKQVIKLPSPH